MYFIGEQEYRLVTEMFYLNYKWYIFTQFSGTHFQAAPPPPAFTYC
jgi:hypothetical protein